MDLDRKICYLGGLPGVGKTTFANKLQEAGTCIHIDSDEELSKLSQDSQRFIRYLFSAIPQNIIEQIKATPNPGETFQELGKMGAFEQYNHRIIGELTLQKALRIRKKQKKHVIISGCISTKESRNYIHNLLNKNGVNPVLIYIRGLVSDIIEVGKQRLSGIGSQRVNINALSLQSLQSMIEAEEPYTLEEKWDYIELIREELSGDIKSIPELQFLLG